MVAKSRRQVAKLALFLLVLLLLLTAILLCIFLLRHRHREREPLPPGGNSSNPDDNIVAFDFSPYLILYKSGRVHRLAGTARVPPGVDEDTGVKSKDVVIDNATGLAARMYLPPSAASAGKKKKDLEQRVRHRVGVHAAVPRLPKRRDGEGARGGGVRGALPSDGVRDSWQALNWVAKHSESGGPEPWLRDRGNLSRIFLAGDSAGANIAHNMAMRAGTDGGELGGGAAAIAGVLLLDPYFWGKKPVAGETTDPATRREYETTWSFICDGRYGIDDPLVDPLSMPAANWRRMAGARVAVTVSGRDNFRPRALAYAAALNDSGWGGEVELYETAGEGHVYFLDKPKDPKSVKELVFVTGFLTRE